MLTIPMFTVQIMVICTFIWTLGRTELLEPLEPNMNGFQIYSTTTNILYDCSALTAMKGNLTTNTFRFYEFQTILGRAPGRLRYLRDELSSTFVSYLWSFD